MSSLAMLKRRALRCETLEKRHLLAADVGFEHNFLSPEDVNANGIVEPFDALQVINTLNQLNRSPAQGAEAVGSDSLLMVDVDADGSATPSDAWKVINYLNGVSRNAAEAVSQVALESRVELIQNAIDAATLPAWIGADTAQDILSELQSGLLPELNSVLQDRFHDGIQRFDLQSQLSELSERLSEAGVQVPSLESLLEDLASALDNHQETVSETVANALNRASQAVEDALDRAAAELAELADRLGHSNGSSNPLDNGLGDLLDGDLLDNGSLPSLEGLANHLHSVLSDVLDSHSEAVQQSLQRVAEILESVASRNANRIEAALDAAEEALAGVLPHLEEAYERVADHFDHLGLDGSPLSTSLLDHIFGSLGHSSNGSPT